MRSVKSGYPRIMSWRAATEADDDALATMFVAFNREDPGQSPVTAEHMVRTLSVLRAEPHRGCAVALETPEGVVGYALLIPFWSNELGGECCGLDELYIRPEARGRGYAGELLEALHAGTSLWPRESVAVILEVSPENAHARALYHRHGFRGGNVGLRRLR